jgi:hypothetical protein
MIKYEYNIVMWLETGFGLVIGFIDYLQIVTISNYKAIANLHTLQITRTHAKSSPSVFTTRFLVTDPNSVLCLRRYWLANVSQLTSMVAAISHQPPTLLTDWTQLTTAPNLSRL